MQTVTSLAQALAQAGAMQAPLEERLAAYARALRALNPPFADAYDALVARLQAGHAGAGAPKVGDMMPPFILPDWNGRLVGLESLLAKGPLILSLNRGHWCPFCKLELTALAQEKARFDALGVAVASIMPDFPAYSARLKDLGVDFLVLSDIDNGYALDLSLAMWVGEPVRGLMAARGLALNEFQGNGGWFLPIPATFVIGQDGRVKARTVDPDFRKRMAIDAIMNAAQKEVLATGRTWGAPA